MQGKTKKLGHENSKIKLGQTKLGKKYKTGRYIAKKRLKAGRPIRPVSGRA